MLNNQNKCKKIKKIASDNWISRLMKSDGQWQNKATRTTGPEHSFHIDCNHMATVDLKFCQSKDNDSLEISSNNTAYVYGHIHVNYHRIVVILQN